MFSSFAEAEAFVQDVIGKTWSGEIVWEDSFEGFKQKGAPDIPAFYLFAEQPPTLVLRAPSEAFDLVVDCRANVLHAASLEQLRTTITQKNGLLF